MNKLTISMLIKSDLFRYTGNTSWSTLVKFFLTNAYFRFQVYLRLSNSTWKLIAIPSRLLKALMGKKVNVQINRQVPVGYGFYIPHGNVVINSQSIIGNNCSFLQFASIGAIHKGKAATFGDNVYVGPNSNIIGDVVIGSNSVIGAGAVIAKDVQDKVVVAGVPGKVIKQVTDINQYCENLCCASQFGGET